jgi:hypothetical protein
MESGRNPFTGGSAKTVLIVACLKNDDKPPQDAMWQMTEAIAKYEKNFLKNEVVVVKFEDLLPKEASETQKKITSNKQHKGSTKQKSKATVVAQVDPSQKYSHPSITGQKFDRLIITGHSRFFPPDNKVSFEDPAAQTKLVGLSLAERMIGGHPLPVIQDFLVFCITTLGVSEINILCCEVAVNIERYFADDGGEKEKLEGAKLEELQAIEKAIKEKRDTKDVSTLQYFITQICADRNIKKHNANLTVKGLNGAGYISKKFDGLWTFEHRYLHESENLKEEDFLEKFVKTKKSAHVFGYLFNPFLLNTLLNKKLKNPKSENFSIFPVDLGFSNSLSNEPILLNGMKVIFDQPVGVYPVNLESKEEARRNGSGK